MKLSHCYIFFLLFIFSGCSSYQSGINSSKNPFSGGIYKIGEPYIVEGKMFFPEEVFSYREVGIASWYGEKFHKKKTANGEIFDMNLLTGAHRTLQLPSLVKVTNISNKKSVILRINDRGPFAKDRIIDVSKKSAKILGFQKNGTATVIVEYYGKANVYNSLGKTVRKKYYHQPKKNNKKFILNIGSFSNKSNLEKLKLKLKGLGRINIEKSKKDSSVYRVFLGPFSSEDFVYRVKGRVEKKGINNSIVKVLN
mgnify:CR=1 FL=1